MTSTYSYRASSGIMEYLPLVILMLCATFLQFDVDNPTTAKFGITSRNRFGDMEIPKKM